MKIERLVKVTWLDSRGVNHGWERLEDTEDETVCSCISVGYVIMDKEDFIKIAPHVADKEDEDFQHCGSMTITKCSIVKIEELK